MTPHQPPIGRCHRSLAKAFSPTVLHDIARAGHSPFLSDLITSCGLSRSITRRTTLREVFEAIYKIISHGDRPEYVYKNALIAKRLLARHRIDSALALTEFRAGVSKADVVIVNGTSTAYEIKSDFDSFERLPRQLASYTEVFDRIYLVTGRHNLTAAHAVLPDHVGLLELTPRYTIKTHRFALSNGHNVNPSVLFDSLRKDEYVPIIQGQFGCLPEASNVHMHSRCKEMFSALPRRTCHDIAFKQIGLKRGPSIGKNTISSVPHALHSLVLTARPSESSLRSFVHALHSPYTV